jgi:hypothetical protein
MVRRFLVAAIVLLALVSSSTAIRPAEATTNDARGAHALIVAVEKTVGPAAGKKLAVLVLITRDGAAPAGALATPSKPLTVLQRRRGPYVVKAEIDSSCTGRCDARYRISGSADHKLDIIPSCRLERSAFVCSRLKIVEVY